MTDQRQQAWAALRASVEAQVRGAYALGPGAVVALVLTLLGRYEQAVEAEVDALRAAFEARLAALAADVAALKAATAKDSHNSSTPPSGDVTRRGRRPRSLRGQSGKRSGGQPGHPGTTLALRAEPDALHTHAPAACAHCGYAFPAAVAAVAVPGERRQVFDLPALTLVCTEHRLAECRCPGCGAWARGAFPPEARATVQYGPGVLALGVALTAQHLIPVARAAEILSTVAGQRISPATLLTAEARTAAAVAPVVARIHAGLARAPVLQCDETGFFVVEGRGPAVSWWLHVACTRSLTYYHAHRRRGRAAFAAIGLLPTYPGTVVHDGLESYRAAAYPCRHALCGAHLLRELTFLAEDCGARWAAAFKRSLRAMKHAADRARAAGAAALDRATRRRYRRRYAALLAAGEAAEPPPAHAPGRTRGRYRRTPGAQLLHRLRRDEDAVLRFLEDLTVPFDNSEAERDLRMMKVEQKVSGGFRTPDGAHRFCTLRSYLVTARKQGVAALDALRHALTGQPFQPAIP
jgi:transposase